MSDRVLLGMASFPAIIAVTAEEQAQGLMYRPWPPPVMAFPSEPGINKLWMRNTPSTLDIVFCAQGTVRDIMEGEPHSTTLVGPDYPVDLVVELPRGWAENHGIRPGDCVSLSLSNHTRIRLGLCHDGKAKYGTRTI